MASSSSESLTGLQHNGSQHGVHPGWNNRTVKTVKSLLLGRLVFKKPKRQCRAMCTMIDHRNITVQILGFSVNDQMKEVSSSPVRCFS